MPEISRFYGIVIKMFFKPKEHEPSQVIPSDYFSSILLQVLVLSLEDHPPSFRRYRKYKRIWRFKNHSWTFWTSATWWKPDLRFLERFYWSSPCNLLSIHQSHFESPALIPVQNFLHKTIKTLFQLPFRKDIHQLNMERAWMLLLRKRLETWLECRRNIMHTFEGKSCRIHHNLLQ